MLELDAKTDMFVKAADVRRRGESPKETDRRNYPRKQISGKRGRGRRAIPFIVLLYDDLVGVVTSGHMTKMVVSHHSHCHCLNLLLYPNSWLCLQ